MSERRKHFPSERKRKKFSSQFQCKTRLSHNGLSASRFMNIFSKVYLSNLQFANRTSFINFALNFLMWLQGNLRYVAKGCFGKV